jgi:hypothetical protein
VAGKAKVVVAVEVREDKTRFVTMQQIESISEDDICKVIDGRPGEDVTAHTYGWKAYGFIMESVPNTPTTIYLNFATGSTLDSGNHKCLIGYYPLSLIVAPSRFRNINPTFSISYLTVDMTIYPCSIFI